MRSRCHIHVARCVYAGACAQPGQEEALLAGWWMGWMSLGRAEQGWRPTHSLLQDSSLPVAAFHLVVIPLRCTTLGGLPHVYLVLVDRCCTDRHPRAA